MISAVGKEGTKDSNPRREINSACGVGKASREGNA